MGLAVMKIYACNFLTNHMNILVKSRFYGWKETTKEIALDHAKWLIRAITTCKTNEERLVIVNSRYQGISFTLDQLL